MTQVLGRLSEQSGSCLKRPTCPDAKRHTARVTLTATSGKAIPKRLTIVASLIALAAVAAIVVWRVMGSGPPHVLGPRVGGFSFVTEPAPFRSSTTQIGFMAPYTGKENPETLTFRSATAHFRRNSAQAVATISVCLPRNSADSGLGGGGVAVTPTLKEYCRQARPVVKGTTLRWGTESTDGEILVLTIRPTRPGVADVDSFTLDYSRDKAHGGQSGVEHVGGQKFVVRAK